MKPRAHAELIKKWADGAQIQYQCAGGPWFDLDNPHWDPGIQYRVKPGPIVKEAQAFLCPNERLHLSICDFDPSNLQLSFDPDTYELIGAEVVKT